MSGSCMLLLGSRFVEREHRQTLCGSDEWYLPTLVAAAGEAGSTACHGGVVQVDAPHRLSSMFPDHAICCDLTKHVLLQPHTKPSISCNDCAQSGENILPSRL